MEKLLTPDALARALADDVAALLGARLGQPAPIETAPTPAGAGWLVTVPFSGLADGRLTAWLDASFSALVAGHASQDGAAPREPGPVSAVRDFVAEVVARFAAKPAWAGISAGELVAKEGAAPPAGNAYRVAIAGAAACGLVTACEFDTPDVRPLSEDRRLEAVLDVDLPLVVRFGRAQMPLRALADLGPGAVIDMGRSPDEPVDLLVGERIIARGEVVIVGGNYGVRITELISGRLGGSEFDART
jgi:flagellar motor switch protein FliN/FliY